MSFKTSILILTLAWSSLSPLDASDRAVDVERYDWSVSLTFDENLEKGSPWRPLYSPLNTLSGEARITLRNVGTRDLDQVHLLFHRLMKPDSILVGGSEQDWDDVLTGLQGREAQQVRHVRIRLSSPLTSGKSVELVVHYGGQMTGYPESGMLYVRETLDPDFTILRSETFCYPQVSGPDAEEASWAARHDAFEQLLTVSVPEGHLAVNGGRLESRQTEDGVTTFSYRSLAPDSTIQIAIAPYRSIERDGHRIFYFESSEEGAKRLSEAMGPGLAWLSRHFGPLPGGRRLTLTEIPDFFGSQAGAMIIQTSAAFNEPESISELYHELSHLWNPPDVDDRPCRWNEGLATYLQALMEEEIQGQPRLEAALERSFGILQKTLSRYPAAKNVPMKELGAKNLTGVSYSAGSLFFALLGERVGREEMLAFLARWSQESRDEGSRDDRFAEALGSAWDGAAADLAERFFQTGSYTEDVAAVADWAELRGRYSAMP